MDTTATLLVNSVKKDKNRQTIPTRIHVGTDCRTDICSPRYSDKPDACKDSGYSNTIVNSLFVAR